jgi:hypothetical protein
LLHLLAAEAEEGGGGKGFAEGVDDLRAVVVAGRFAGGEKDARVGWGGDRTSLDGAAFFGTNPKSVAETALDECIGLISSIEISGQSN